MQLPIPHSEQFPIGSEAETWRVAATQGLMRRLQRGAPAVPSNEKMLDQVCKMCFRRDGPLLSLIPCLPGRARITDPRSVVLFHHPYQFAVKIRAGCFSSG